MASFDEKTLLALGLEPATKVQSIETAHWGDAESSFGFSQAEPIDFYAQPANILTERVPLPAFEDATGGEVRRHRESGGVAYLSVPGASLRPAGVTATAGAHAVVIDARQSPTAVRVDLQWFTYVLLFQGNSVEVLTPEAVDELFAPATVVPAPTAETIFADLPAEPWLLDAFRARAALPSSWSRAAAAGLAARLWRPPSTGDVTVDRLRTSGSPASRAVAWFGALPERDRSFLRHAVVRHTDDLMAGLELAIEEAEREPSEPPESLHAVAMRRDDAESVRALLPREAREAISSALARLDRRAEANWSSLSAYSWPDDPRLQAVLRSEPDAWWGRLAEQ